MKGVLSLDCSTVVELCNWTLNWLLVYKDVTLRNTLFFAVIQTIFWLFFCAGPVLAEDDETKETVYSLQQAGWKVAQKNVCQESRLGVAPYQFLRRVLSVTTYWLHLDKEEIICKIIYDSQLDSQYETCGERHPVLETFNHKALDC